MTMHNMCEEAAIYEPPDHTCIFLNQLYLDLQSGFGVKKTLNRTGLFLRNLFILFIILFIIFHQQQ